MRGEGSSKLFAWQGWKLRIPRSWNPVKLDGNWERGQALLADLDRTKLALRWEKPRRRKFNPDKWAHSAMIGEVGRLAALEAKALPLRGVAESQLYLDPDPPGRDVWMGFFQTSGRAVQMVYHARRRDRALAEEIAPSLEDTPADREMAWSVFDLSCRSPAGFALREQRLNAGDLSLMFTRKREWVMVRQIAVAKLALARMGLDKLLSQQLQKQKHYAGSAEVRQIEMGRGLKGLGRSSERRTRFGWMRWLPREIMTAALHDEARDRIIIAQGTCESLIDGIVASVGRIEDEYVSREVQAEQT